MAQQTLSEQVKTLSELFEERMRVKGPDFARQIKKSGHKMPKRARKAAKKIIENIDLMDHPRLSRQVDQVAIRTAIGIVTDHLETLNPRDQAIGRLLNTLAKFSFVLILGFVAVIWYLWSRGSI